MNASVVSSQMCYIGSYWVVKIINKGKTEGYWVLHCSCKHMGMCGMHKKIYEVNSEAGGGVLLYTVNSVLKQQFPHLKLLKTFHNVEQPFSHRKINFKLFVFNHLVH